jgi:hypothetical protein
MTELMAAVEEDSAVSQQPEQQTEKGECPCLYYTFKQYRIHSALIEVGR